MSHRDRRRGAAGWILGAATGVVLCAALALPASAYTPGSGTIYSTNFNGTLDPDWEQGNGIGSSPWKQRLDGPDRAFYGDGSGPFPGASPKHWARHFTSPVEATSYSAAFEYRSDLGGTYAFDFEVEQRAPTLRKYRLRVNASGAMSLWRSEAGALVQKIATAAGTVPVNQVRWLRFAIEADPSGNPRVRARIWSGSATSEPSTWTIEFLDDLDTLVRVHRFELVSNGPVGTRTWIDDLDVFGNGGAGIASSVTTIYMVEASHLDIGFTEPPDDIEAFSKTHLDQVLANLDAAPEYRWTIETAWYLDRWWERSTEAQRQNMVAKLQSGRMSLAAGYASLHTTTAGHEELTRNVYWASRFAGAHGVPLRTFIHDDVPGATFATPELLARAGLEFYVGGMNTPFGGRLTRPSHGDRPFWWVGPDGSRILSWITFDSYAEAFDYGFSFFDNFDDLYYKLGKKLPEQEEAGYPYPRLMLMRAFDNHYGGFKVRDLVNQWNATYSTPVFVLATAEEFFDVMLATHGPGAFPSFSGDFGAAWSNSHAAAQHTEEWVRQSHREGRAAEALLAAGSAVDDGPVPRDDVDTMYRMMLQVDEHSGAGGWPEYFTPEEMDRNNRIHLGYAVDARDTAAALLVQGTDRAIAELPAAGDAVAVVNPLGRARDAWVQIALAAALYGSTFRVVDRASGSEIPFQRFDAASEIRFRASQIPPVGYRVYDLLPGTPTASPSGMLSVTSTTIENDFYRLVVDPSDGALTSLYDKTASRELIDTASVYRFNRLGSNVKSEADASAAPVAHAVTSASISIASAGPLLGALKVTRTGTPHVETVYRLHRGENRVEIENVLDKGQMPYVPYATSWRAYFVTMPFDIHNFQIRSETTTRFLDPIADGFQRTSYFDWHNVEHTLGFFDGTKGVLYACDAVDAHHFETLSTLSSTSWSRTNALLLSRLFDRTDEYKFEGGQVGSFQMEPDTSPVFRYVHHIRATGPSFDPVAASRFGFEALSPLPSRLLVRRPGNLPHASASFFSVDASAVLLYTVKGADDGDGVILRMTELAGSPVTARVSSETFDLSDPERVEQDEEGGSPLVLDAGDALVPLGAYETATVRLRASRTWLPITLMAVRDDENGTVRLDWSGGVTPWTLRRSEDAPFTLNVTTIVDEQPVTGHDDPVLNDGKTWFYLAY